MGTEAKKQNIYTGNDIAVIGLAGKFPEAEDAEIFWENIMSGRDSVRSLPDSRMKELEEILNTALTGDFVDSGYLDTISLFDPEYFGISPAECKYIDPQQRLLLELTAAAVQNAGYSIKSLTGQNRAGIFMGYSKNEYGMIMDPSMPMALVNSLESSIAGRIAYTFNFSGPTLTIDTACSSSLVALHYACQSLRLNECEYALAGGVNIDLFPGRKEYLASSPIMSKGQKVRAFDKDADGTVGGEGGGVLLLKNINKALEDGDVIHAVIKGSAVNSNGKKSVGLTAPNQEGQQDVILTAIRNAHIDPLTISYIETHGTGTKLGDPVEVEGIHLAFSQYTDRKQFLPIGSLKTNIGHLDSASGIANTIKVIMALKHKKLPKSLHFNTPNPQIDFVNSAVYVNDEPADWNVEGVRRAGVTSLGLTGTNVHLILEEFPACRESFSANDGINIITLSAKNQISLQKNILNLKKYLEENEAFSVDDIAYTLNTGRDIFHHRVAFVGKSKAEVIEKLQILSKELKTGQGVCYGCADEEEKHVSPVFIYLDIPDGAEFETTDCHITEPLFRQYYGDCLKTGSADLNSEYFAYQYAYSKFLDQIGLRPKAVLGTGIGKFVSDTIQNKITAEKGLALARGYKKDHQETDSGKLRMVIEKMIKDGHNLFVLIGKENTLGYRIREIVKQIANVNYLYLNVKDELYNGICQLYVNGYTFNWSNYYSRGDRKRVSLPTYAFHQKSYLLKADISSHIHQAAATREEEKSVGEITFDEIYTIFDEVVSDDIDLTKDFEESGGDSIAILQIVEIIKKRYRLSVSMELFYTTPSVRELIDQIIGLIHESSSGIIKTRKEGGNSDERSAKIVQVKSNIMDAQKTEKLVYKKEEPGNILLTGGTGFLGAHVLKELLFETKANLYCLVRGHSLSEAQKRLEERLQFYFGSQLQEHYKSRIRVVNGEIAKPDSGIEKKQYDELAEVIDTVFHSAAIVSHYGKYSKFNTVNVLGTKQMIDFCLTRRDKRFHHVSTLAVSGTSARDYRFKEDDFDFGQSLENMVYANSKFEAERLVFEARDHGLRASVYRVGSITGRYTDGLFQENIDTNLLYSLIKGIILLRKTSSSINAVKLDLIPVDVCVQAMVKLMLWKDVIDNTFHFTHPDEICFGEVVGAVKNLGYEIEEMDNQPFYDHLTNEIEKKAFIKEVSMIYNSIRDQNAAAENEGKIIYCTDFTKNILDKAGFIYPKIDLTYIEKILQYCKEVGYIT